MPAQDWDCLTSERTIGCLPSIKMSEFSIQSMTDGTHSMCQNSENSEHAQEPTEAVTCRNIPPVCDLRFLTIGKIKIFNSILKPCTGPALPERFLAPFLRALPVLC